MSLKVANRVKESTLTSGNGTIALAGALNGYQSFSSVLSNGDTTYYTIVNNNNWEVGIGTYSSGTLSRDSILSSSNLNNKLSLSGQSFVFIAYPSEKSIYKDQNDQVIAGSSGIIIDSGNPSNISNVLYNISGILHFNGFPVNSDPDVVAQATALVTTVFNRTSSPIPKFTVVYISGGQGDLPTITPAIASIESKSSKTYGVTQNIIPAMDSGHIVSYGNITGVNTDAYNINAPHGDINGRVLYLSPTVSGGLTIDKPYAPDHLVAIGTVIRTHQNVGIFNVRIQNGFELEELHNVATTGAISGQFLKYDGSLWRNTGILSSDISDLLSTISGVSTNNISITGVSGINVSKSGNSYTISATGSFGLTSTQIQQLLNSGVSANILSGTGNFNSLSVNSVSISLSGHTHTSSQITDFNSSVSGLLPSVSGSGYVRSIFSNNGYIISVSGLQTSGNYSLVGHSHTTSDISNFNTGVSGLLTQYALLSSGNFANLFVTGVPVSLSGHTHISSQITDFNSSVSGLLAIRSVSGSGYVIVSSSGGNYIISVSGLQQSGNYSLVGHNHTTADITNFNTGVSGLLPVTNILGSGNTSVVQNGTTFIISSSGTGTSSSGLTQQQVQSFLNSGVSIYITSGTGLFNSLSINGTGVSVSGHKHVSTDITDFNSSVSGLIPITGVVGSGYVVATNINKTITLSITGLQPSGNYSLVGHNHIATDITNFNSSVSGLLNPYALLSSGNFSSLFITGVPVSLSGHTHTSSQITDFNTAVNNQITVKNVSGSGYVSIASITGNYIVSVTGLQPSGNYSIVGHTHVSNDITNFNTSVSGLLRVTNIIGSGSISVTSSGSTFIISSTGTGGGGGGGGSTVTNYGSNRVLVSDGTPSGISAQSGLVFDGKNLFVNGVNISNASKIFLWSTYR
jgi:methylglyoxal synthase